MIWTYPGFQSLPEGVKQMLLVSEAHFANEVKQTPTSAVLGRADGARYLTPQLIRPFKGQFRGSCEAWGNKTS